jgi:hypothetical protein
VLGRIEANSHVAVGLQAGNQGRTEEPLSRRRAPADPHAA